MPVHRSTRWLLTRRLTHKRIVVDKSSHTRATRDIQTDDLARVAGVPRRASHRTDGLGFYVFAIAVSAALLLLAYADVAKASYPNPRLMFFCLAGAGSVIWSIIPRRDVMRMPGGGSSRSMGI